MKPDLTTTEVNDYIKFESVDEAYGMPLGEIAKPGDARYFRITKKYQGTAVAACCGNNRIYFDAHMMDSDGVHVVEARFPMTFKDWRLQVSLPTPGELPWGLRISRWFHNLPKISIYPFIGSQPRTAVPG